MSKKKTSVHYNDAVKRVTIDMFLSGKSEVQIERAIRKMIRDHKSRGGK